MNVASPLNALTFNLRFEWKSNKRKTESNWTNRICLLPWKGSCLFLTRVINKRDENFRRIETLKHSAARKLSASSRESSSSRKWKEIKILFYGWDEWWWDRKYPRKYVKCYLWRYSIVFQKGFVLRSTLTDRKLSLLMVKLSSTIPSPFNLQSLHLHFTTQIWHLRLPWLPGVSFPQI